jgi:5'-nucleotidase
MTKPKILITNDDGIDSPGIYTLVKEIEKIGIVTVVAPDRQQSAVANALTIHQPLRINKFFKNNEFFGYSINGTPSDCVKLAVLTILKEKPDYIISGINHGQNTSINLLYSGTVSAGIEGLIFNIPSIAVSLTSYDINADTKPAALWTSVVLKKLIDNPLNVEGVLFNINVPVLPMEQIKGLKITRQGDSYWLDEYEKRKDPFGRDYYWFSGDYIIQDDDIETDDGALAQGFVSLTPIKIDYTKHELIPILKKWQNNC